MKKMLLLVLVVVLGALVGGPAQATTIDFEDLDLYSKPESIAYPGVTFSQINIDPNITINPTFFVDSTIDYTNPPYDSPLPVGPPLSGKVLIGQNTHYPGEAYQATFSIGGVRSVSVDIGDMPNEDEDPIFLRAFNANNDPLEYTLYNLLIGASEGHTLSVFTSEDIKCVTFGSSGGTAGSVYFDNFTFVPLPGAVWLLGSGLLGLASWRRFRKS